MAVRFNINDQVKIKLTERGQKVHDDYYRGLGLDPSVYDKKDFEDKLTMPMWQVMQILAPGTFMGPESCIAGNEIEFA